MSDKTIYYAAVAVGSIVGGYLPTFFGASVFSLWSIIGSAVGATVLLILAYKFVA